MKFGSITVDAAEGCVLAHSTRTPERTLKKGHILAREDLELLKKAGYGTIIAARLEAGDLGEDEAARKIAEAAAGSFLRPDAPFTGRVNLYAQTAGLFVVDKAAVDTMNRIDPAVTLGTLASHTRVAEDRMVATAKIIPFAVSRELVAKAQTTIADGLKVLPFRRHKVGLIATMLGHLKPATMDKTRRVLEQRLQASGSSIVAEKRVPHTAEAVADAIRHLDRDGADFLILFGASAVVDRHDVLPASIELAGGSVKSFGMPVDPGNLLLSADYNGKPVLGAPGCARSPKENGFDWVLDRLMAGIEVTQEDISGMGVGGLLMEIGSRPQPREFREHKDDPKVAGIVLAAGKSSRMGDANKLLEHIDGKPLVARTGRAAVEAGLSQTVLVTGHMADDVAHATKDIPLLRIHNPDYADGMSSSIRAGVRAVADQADAVLIMLGDMPEINAEAIKSLVQAYKEDPATLIVAASAQGKRGNPVLWDSRYFADLIALEGDTGARHIIAANTHVLKEVDIGSRAHVDLDTPDAFAAYRASNDQ